MNRLDLSTSVVALALLGGHVAAYAQTCRAVSASSVPTVVELYTSEGCNSCPPADRWLSTLKERSDVIAAAFHVDYWDGLGWKDRFADPRFSQRQAQLQAADGVRSSYTPQVRVNGADWRRWPQLPASSHASTVDIALRRDGAQVVLDVQPHDEATGPLSLWWAALEDGHDSDVRAGENGGARLHHDLVVRRYGSVASWRGPLQQRLAVPVSGEGGRPWRVIAVVTEASRGTPVGAVQLRCPG